MKVIDWGGDVINFVLAHTGIILFDRSLVRWVLITPFTDEKTDVGVGLEPWST